MVDKMKGEHYIIHCSCGFVMNQCRVASIVPVHFCDKPEAGMSHTGTAEQRSIYQPDRDSTESRDSDSPTVVQTHFWTGKYCVN